MTASNAASIPANDSGGSPPFVTGGGGFAYEDRVAAYVLAAMLAEQPPFGEELDIVVRVDWQTGVSGWRFDDLLVTHQGTRERRTAISCKSGRYVTGGGWPEEAVTRVWEQWTRSQGNPFRKGDDVLAIATGNIAQDAKEAWDRLLQDAIVGDPARFMQLYQSNGTSSQVARNIVESLTCPANLAAQVADEPHQRFELIRHLRLWLLDALALDSAAITRATEWCRSALLSGDRVQADTLFQELVSIASARRPHSGTITKHELVALLAPRFALRVAPSHEASWAALDTHSAELQADIRMTLNNAVCLIHPGAWPEILNATTPGKVVLLEGESGCGKSALAKRLCEGDRRVLWLSASDLEHTTLAAVGTQLGATVPLSTLLDEERSANALLVIDGAERLSNTGHRTASRLAATAIRASRPWTVVVTTQEGGADAFIVELGKQSELTEPIRSIEVRLPDEIAIREVLDPLGLNLSAKASSSLLRALRNLKALDWVARASNTHDLATFPDLVEQVWSGLLGTTDARARAEVLKKLGKEDAALVVGGVPSSVLTTVEEQRVVATLIQDGLLRERRQRLFFRHDLLGDWARLLVLIESGETAAQVLQDVSDSLRWGPAIRLFAEWLIQEGDPERRQLVSLLVSAPLNGVSLTLLEGIFRSPDCGPVIAALLDNDTWCTPETLSKWLATFASVATQPAAICRVISKAHPESASIRATFRTPVHELWPMVLIAIDARAQILAQKSPLALGTITRIWLSDNATVVRQEFAAVHRACAHVAVEAARELQARIAESRYYSRDNGTQHVFEAALYAAPWLPDEVSSLALELSGRRPDPQSVTECVEAEQKRVSEAIKERLAKMSPEELKRRQGGFSLGPTPRRKRKPFADGPTRRINDDFRKAILTPGVLVRLTMSRPDVAQETLLACCLDDPDTEDPLYSDHYLGDQTGTVDQMGWYPPLHLRGPWLTLLAQVPEQGLQAILRLVEAGMTEWLRLQVPPPDHPKHEWVVKITTITMNIDGIDHAFRGDHQVFGWYRGYGRPGNLVASALMALESWLYGLIDAKQPVDWVIRQILETSGSVAMLGVLAALARRNGELLDGSLRPLVSSWMLLDWDEHITVQARMPSFDPFGLKSLNTVYDDMADQWSSLPHRRTSLPWLIAQKLALGQVEIVEACESSRNSWQAEIDAGTCLSPETVQRFIALLDPRNLSLGKLPDGHLVVSVNWPSDLAAKYEEQGKNSNAGVTAFQLRQLGRKILDNDRALTDEQAQVLWDAASSLAEPASTEDDLSVMTVVDARAAAAAMLENHASGWLDRFPERRAWCEAAALAAVRDRGDMDIHTHGMSMFKEHGEAFAGAWAVARIAAGDARESVRRALAEAMTAKEYLVTGQVLAAAVRLAANMPGDLGRLFNLTWLWAALRNLAGGSWEARAAVVRRERLIDAYVQGRIPNEQIPWDELKLRAARMHERHERRWRVRRPAWNLVEQPANAAPPPLPQIWDEYSNHGFNWGVLEKVVEPLPFVVRPSLGPDLSPLIEFDRRLLDLTAWTMKRAAKRHRRDSDSLPNMLDRHTLGRVASIIADHEDEIFAMSVWHTLAPHLALHYHWAEAFFSEWFSTDRSEPERADRFHRRWRLMIAHTDGLSEWARPDDSKWYDLSKARSALLGIHERGSKLGRAEDRPYLSGMVDRYAAWAKMYAADSWRLRSFCHFLQKPGALDLRLPALVWVRDALVTLAGYRVTEKELLNEVVGLCAAVWYQQSTDILASAPARSALIAIVQHLSQLQVSEIQELKEDLEVATAQGPAARSESSSAGDADSSIAS